ncbi:PLxRFG domain-containing protein [Bacterioplanoides sp.]|uniref:PLxRFG domain-containing protein n=1 Tax=Bacterioplanoides sp. TaxID=2066072 RepID=UPI003B5ADE74
MSWQQEWQGITEGAQYQGSDDSQREAMRNDFFARRIAPNFAPYEQQEVKNLFDQDTAPQGNPDATFAGESLNLLKAGLLSSIADTAQGFTLGHSNRLADWMRTGAEESMQQVSPTTLEEMENTGFDYDRENGLSIKDDSSFRGLLGLTMQGLGSVGTSVVGGGLLGKAVGLAGRAGAGSAVAGRLISGSDKSIRALTARKNYDRAQSIINAAEAGTRVGTHAGFSGMSSAMMVGSVASQSYGEVMNMPDQEIRKLAPFQKLVQEETTRYPDNPAMAEAEARKRLAKEVSLSGRGLSALIGAVTGNIANPMEAKMLLGKGATSRISNAIRGGMAESVEEFTQTAGQEYLSNKAQAEVAERDIDVMDGVIGEAVSSMVIGGLTGGSLGLASRPGRIATKEDVQVKINDADIEIDKLKQQLSDESLKDTERDQVALELTRQMRERHRNLKEFAKAPTAEQVARRKKGRPDPESDTGQSQPSSNARNWVYPDIEKRLSTARNEYRKAQTDYSRSMAKGGNDVLAGYYESQLRKKQDQVNHYQLFYDHRKNQQYFQSKEQFDDWINRVSLGGTETSIAMNELQLRKTAQPVKDGMLNIRRQIEAKREERAARRPLPQPTLQERYQARKKEQHIDQQEQAWEQLQQEMEVGKMFGKHLRGMASLKERGKLMAGSSKALAIYRESLAQKKKQEEALIRKQEEDRRYKENQIRAEEAARERKYHKLKSEQERRDKKEREARTYERERRRVQTLLTEKIHFKQQNIGRYQVWPVGKDKFAVGGIDPDESGAMHNLGGYRDESGTWSFPRNRRVDVLSSLESMAKKPKARQKKKSEAKTRYPKTERKQQRRRQTEQERQLRKELAASKAQRQSDQQFSRELAAEWVRPTARKILAARRKARQDAVTKRISDLQAHLDVSVEPAFERVSEQSREYIAKAQEAETAKRGMADKLEQEQRKSRQQEKQEQVLHQRRLNERHWQQVEIGPYQVWAASDDHFMVSGAMKSESARMRDLGGFFNKTLASWQFPKDSRFEIESALQQMAKDSIPVKVETFTPSEKERRKQASRLEQGRREYRPEPKATEKRSRREVAKREIKRRLEAGWLPGSLKRLANTEHRLKNPTVKQQRRQAAQAVAEGRKYGSLVDLFKAERKLVRKRVIKAIEHITGEKGRTALNELMLRSYRQREANKEASEPQIPERTEDTGQEHKKPEAEKKNQFDRIIDDWLDQPVSHSYQNQSRTEFAALEATHIRTDSSGNKEPVRFVELKDGEPLYITVRRNEITDRAGKFQPIPGRDFLYKDDWPGYEPTNKPEPPGLKKLREDVEAEKDRRIKEKEKEFRRPKPYPKSEATHLYSPKGGEKQLVKKVPDAGMDGWWRTPDGHLMFLAGEKKRLKSLEEIRKDKERQRKAAEAEERKAALEKARELQDIARQEAKKKERFKNSFLSRHLINHFIGDNGLHHDPAESGLTIKEGKGDFHFVDDSGNRLSARALTGYVDAIRDGFFKYQPSKRAKPTKLPTIRQKNLQDKEVIGNGKGEAWNKARNAKAQLKKLGLEKTHYVSGDSGYFVIRKIPDLSGINWEYLSYENRGAIETIMVPANLEPGQAAQITDYTGQRVIQYRKPEQMIIEGGAEPKKGDPVIRLTGAREEFLERLAETAPSQSAGEGHGVSKGSSKPQKTAASETPAGKTVNKTAESGRVEPGTGKTEVARGITEQPGEMDDGPGVPDISGIKKLNPETAKTVEAEVKAQAGKEPLELASLKGDWDSIEQQLRDALLAGQHVTEGWYTYQTEDLSHTKGGGWVMIVTENDTGDAYQKGGAGQSVWSQTDAVDAVIKKLAPQSTEETEKTTSVAEEYSHVKDLDKAISQFTNTGQVLDYLIKNTSGVRKTVAQKLKDSGINVPFRYADKAFLKQAVSGLDEATRYAILRLRGKSGFGLYTFDNKTVNIKALDQLGGLVSFDTYAGALLHEITHAAIDGRLSDRYHARDLDLSNPIDRIHDIYDVVFRASLRNGHLNDYGMKDSEEFIAEAMGNADFQAYLKTIKYGKYQSVWSAFVHAVRDILGLPKESKTALEAVLQAFDELSAPETTGAKHETGRKSSDESLAGTPAGKVQDAETTGQAEAGSGKGSRPGSGNDGNTDRTGAEPSGSQGDRGKGADLSGASTTSESDLRQRTGGVASGATDFTIDSKIAEDIAGGGRKSFSETQRFDDNIAAIRLLQELGDRPATAEQMEVLAKYVGWGGLQAAFPDEAGKTRKGWGKKAKLLKELLTEDEYQAAMASTPNAHYTTPEIVNAIYTATNQFGAHYGRVLEPSVGTGNFIGLMPPDMRGNSNISAVELDVISGRIAGKLYPSAKINTPVAFQDFDLANNSYDIVVANPPFGSTTITDAKRKDISGWRIHNYFLAKSMDALRPGGVMSVVVSKGWMDSNYNQKGRDRMFRDAKLTGAFRMPGNAFKSNANTDVTTDLLFFQKREIPLSEEQLKAPPATEIDFRNKAAFTGADGSTMNINQYFSDNPDRILGDAITSETGMYGPGARDVVIVREGHDWQKALNDGIGQLPKRIFNPEHNVSIDLAPDTSMDINHADVGGIYLSDDGKLMRRDPDVEGKQYGVPVTGYTNSNGEFIAYKKGDITKLNQLLPMARTARELIQKQITEVADHELKLLRDKLNQQYDEFVKKNKALNRDANKRLLYNSDPTIAPMLLALESKYEKEISKQVAAKTGQTARKEQATKADIFTRRTQSPYSSPKTADSGQSGLIISLSETGKVDMAMMENLTGKDRAELYQELKGQIFHDPQAGWQTKDAYLSGNVKEKLRQAQEMVAQGHFDDLGKQLGTDFRENIKALEAVIPKDVQATDINVRMGGAWQPPSVIMDFWKHLTGGDAKVSFVPQTNKWFFNGHGTRSDLIRKWSSEGASPAWLIERVLNNRQIVVKKKGPDDTLITDKKATEAANVKAEEIQGEFESWLWKDPKRRDQLVRTYNDTMNTTVNRTFDGSHLAFPGKVSDDIIKFRTTQSNAIWRMVQNQATLLDHVVGAGKTFTMIGGAMEMRRMGLAKKPVIVVPNHLVEQWAADFALLYPNAKVLAATANDFSARKRKQLFAMVATGDWDAVIVSHSSFGKLPGDPAAEEAFLRQQLKDLTESEIAAREAEGKDSRSTKELANARGRLKEKLKKLLENTDKDTGLTFQELGIDAVFLDEAHEFKNLEFQTSMNRVKNINPTGSNKASDMFIKTQAISSRGGKLVYATGTPISNSMAEMYTMQRYLGYEALKKQGLAHFDAWAKQFGRIETKLERKPSGKYEPESRFATFINIPELMQQSREFSDVINNDDIIAALAAEGKGKHVPNIKGDRPANIVAERSLYQEGYMADIERRFGDMPDDPREDNPLKATNDARKAALDMRMIYPELPDFAGSKINKAVDSMMENYHQWADDKGTQLVFCDLSTPKGRSADKSIKDFREKLTELTDNAFLKNRIKNTDPEELYDLLLEMSGDDRVNADKAMKLIDRTNPDDINSLGAKFDVYNDVKKKLISKGVPASEIAFIHDASTDKQKAELFAAVNSGKVRFLMGSTAKMGAGTNVQERLVALHHLDAPWRPSDLEQREGRIIRQGNRLYIRDPQNFEVAINRYSTEMTYDVNMWQTLEIKAKFIGQIRNGDSSVREAQDVAGEAASAAEMKAASSGDPRILEQVEIQRRLGTLQNLRRSHQQEQLNAGMMMEFKQREQNRLTESVEKMRQDFGAVEPVRKDKKGTVIPSYINTDGTRYTKTADAVKAVTETVNDAIGMNRDEAPLGTYRGMEVSYMVSEYKGQPALDVYLSGKSGTKYAAITNRLTDDDGTFRISGVFTSLNSAISKIDKIRENDERNLKQIPDEIQGLKEQKDKPFRYAQEYEQKKVRNQQLLEELGSANQTNEAAKELPQYSQLQQEKQYYDSAVQTATDDASRLIHQVQLSRVNRLLERLQYAPEGKEQDIAKTVDAGLEKIKSETQDLSQYAQVASRYSLSDSRTAKKNYQAKAVAGKLEKAISHIATVVRTEAGLPEHLRRQIEQDGVSGRVKGVYDPVTDQVYVVAGNASSVADGIRTALHEAVGHKGLRSLLGDSLDTVLDQVYRSLSPDQISSMRDQYTNQIAGKPSAEQRRILAEEHLAHLAESDPKNNLLKKAVARIRQWLRKHFPNLKFSDNDLRQMVIDAKRRAGLTESATGRTTPAQSEATIRYQMDLDKVDENVRKGIRAARQVLKSHKDIRSAMHRPDIGDIDLIWGKEGQWPPKKKAQVRKGQKGLAHIIEARIRKNKLTEAEAKEVLFKVIETMAKGDIVDRSRKIVDGVPEERLKIEMGPYRAFLVNEDTNISNHYLLSGFEVSASGDTRQAQDRPGSTHNRPTRSRSEVGAEAKLSLKDNTDRNQGIPDKPEAARYKLDKANRMDKEAFKEAAAENLTSLKDKILDSGALGTLGGRQIRRVFSRTFDAMGKGNKNPLTKIDLLTQAMGNLRGQWAHKAEAVEKIWSKLTKDKWAYQKTNDIMYASTLAGVDPRWEAYRPKYGTQDELKSKIKSANGRNKTRLERQLKEEQQRLNDYNQLRQQYLLLGKKNKLGHQVFEQVSDFYEKQFQATLEAMNKRVEGMKLDPHATGQLKAEIQAMFTRSIADGPYFPLMRFGRYAIVAKTKDGEHYREHFESLKAMKMGRVELERQGYEIVSTGKTAEIQTSQLSGVSEFTGKIYQALESDRLKNIDDKAKLEFMDEINQLSLAMLPELSAAKRSMHRRKVPGFDTNARRAFNSVALHGSNRLSRIEYGWQIESELNRMDDAVSETNADSPLSDEDKITGRAVATEMRKRHQENMNPKGNALSAVIVNGSFLMTMGGSLGAGLVNMTQNVLVGLPVLAGQYGFRKSAGIMMSSMMDYVRNGNQLSKDMDADDFLNNPWLSLHNKDPDGKITADEIAIIRALTEDGTIETSPAHNIAARAGTDIQPESQVSREWMNKAMKASGMFFHNAEVFNRQLIALTALRLYKEKHPLKTREDMEKAQQYVRDQVLDAHFDYSTYNRPRHFKGNMAKVMLIFKQYSQNMTFHLGNAFREGFLDKAATPEEKAAAKKVLYTTLGMHFAFAGALGLPGMSMVLGGLQAAFGDEDDPEDFKTKMRNNLADAVGPTMGHILSKGLFDGAFNIGMHTRTSLNNLWISDPGYEMTARQKGMYYFTNVFGGPAANLAINASVGLSEMAQGDTMKGIQRILPKFIRDGVRAFDYTRNGIVDKNGRVMQDDYRYSEAAMQVFGIAPARQSEMWDASGAMTGYETALSKRRNDLMRKLDKAVRTGNRRMEARIRKNIQVFNRRHEGDPVSGWAVIEDKQIKRSLKSKRQARENAVLGRDLPSTRSGMVETLRGYQY